MKPTQTFVSMFVVVGALTFVTGGDKKGDAISQADRADKQAGLATPGHW